MQRVRTAPQALVALEGTPFKIVIVDIGTATTRTLEMLRGIRSISTAAVLVMSTSADSASVAAALDAGANDYLPKPVHPSELRARVRTMLRRMLRAGRPSAE